MITDTVRKHEEELWALAGSDLRTAAVAEALLDYARIHDDPPKETTENHRPSK